MTKNLWRKLVLLSTLFILLLSSCNQDSLSNSSLSDSLNSDSISGESSEITSNTSADIFGINETSFPTYKTNFLENGTTRRVGYTLSASSTNLSADYLDVVNVPGESGTSTDGRWIKYFYPNDPGKLKVKSSGTYNIYISLFDDYSWARIYIEPAI